MSELHNESNENMFEEPKVLIDPLADTAFQT